MNSKNLQFDIIGSINDDIYAALKNYIYSQPEPISKLTVNIISVGGSVTPAIGIYNFLKSLPFHIHTHNLGEVSSAAILPYLSGKTRTAEPISKFMIHPIKIGIKNEMPYNAIQEILHNLELDIKNFQKIINIETNSLNGNHNIEKLLKSDSLILDSQSAYKCGIVTCM